MKVRSFLRWVVFVTILILILFYLKPAPLLVNDPPKPLPEPPPVEVKKPVILTGVPITTWKGGHYHAHFWQDGFLGLDLLNPDGKIYRVVGDKKTEVTLTNHNYDDGHPERHKRITHAEMKEFLDKNGSEKLIATVGVFKGKCDGIMILIVPEKNAEQTPPPMEQESP